MEKGTLSGLRCSSDDAARSFPGLPRVIVPRLLAIETGPVTDTPAAQGPKARGRRPCCRGAPIIANLRLITESSLLLAVEHNRTYCLIDSLESQLVVDADFVRRTRTVRHGQ